MIGSIVTVPVGGHCRQNGQCQGSKNSGVCEHQRCACRSGYVLFNLECYEGKVEVILKKYFLNVLKGNM